MIALQRDIASAFSAQEARVTIANGRTLTVTFAGARQEGLPPKQLYDFCRTVAMFVRDNYTGYGHLTRVQVSFATRQVAGPLRVTKAETPCGFTTEDLGVKARNSESK